MKYFRCLERAIDPQPYLDEIDAVEGIWHEQTGRQKSADVQCEALAIPVRGLVRGPLDLVLAAWRRATQKELRAALGLVHQKAC